MKKRNANSKPTKPTEPFLVVVLNGCDAMVLNYPFSARIGRAEDAKAAAYAAVRELNLGDDKMAFDARELGCQPAFVLSRHDLEKALKAMESADPNFQDVEVGISGQDLAGPEDLSESN